MKSNVITSAQLIALFDLLLRVVDEPGVTQERMDAFVFVVMAAIPWVFFCFMIGINGFT